MELLKTFLRMAETEADSLYDEIPENLRGDLDALTDSLYDMRMQLEDMQRRAVEQSLA